MSECSLNFERGNKSNHLIKRLPQHIDCSMRFGTGFTNLLQLNFIQINTLKSRVQKKIGYHGAISISIDRFGFGGSTESPLHKAASLVLGAFVSVRPRASFLRPNFLILLICIRIHQDENELRSKRWFLFRWSNKSQSFLSINRFFKFSGDNVTNFMTVRITNWFLIKLMLSVLILYTSQGSKAEGCLRTTHFWKLFMKILFSFSKFLPEFFWEAVTEIFFFIFRLDRHVWHGIWTIASSLAS